MTDVYSDIGISTEFQHLNQYEKHLGYSHLKKHLFK